MSEYLKPSLIMCGKSLVVVGLIGGVVYLGLGIMGCYDITKHMSVMGRGINSLFGGASKEDNVGIEGGLDLTDIDARLVRMTHVLTRQAYQLSEARDTLLFFSSSMYWLLAELYNKGLLNDWKENQTDIPDSVSYMIKVIEEGGRKID